MSSINKRLLRLALAIHAGLAAPSLNGPLIELPAHSWDRCAQLVRQIRRARLRNWHLAAELLSTELKSAMISLADEIASARSRLPRASEASHIAIGSDIYEDLLAISQEFEELDYDCRTRQLSVSTEPIVLEGIYLGPFEIRLHWSRSTRDESAAYRVIAKDPHPAESRDNVTHPHVLDEVLCEGDGRHAIRQALAQGRLLDFFSLVAGVLRNYNAESPFVELALWNGRSCSDCGAVVDDEESYACQNCHANVCGECGSVCCRCEDSYCSACIGSCAACEDNFCRRCLKSCEGCQARVCAGCLDVHERCPDCHEEETNEDDGADDEVAARAGTEVQSNSLGQALVSA